MSELLYRYYERELLFIRQLAHEFAKQYPAAANRLLLEPNRSTDPHVERLIESFALLAGRVHLKIDDEFPELTDALLGVLYPHYLAPIPSMTVVQFQLDPMRGELPNGFLIDRFSKLHTQPVRGLSCKYRTGYPVTLWPIEVTDARLQPPPFPAGLKPPPGAVAALRLRFDCTSKLKLPEMAFESLRFYLFGDAQLIPSLYEILFNNVVQVMVRSLDPSAKLPPLVFTPEQCLSPVGFERDEGLLPYPNQSFLGYRLLTEFFTFPQKFFFVDFGGWKQIRHAGFNEKIEVILFLNHTLTTLEQGVNASMFRMGCTPVVNLFEQIAEPIPLTQTRHEYRVLPDVAHQMGMEVYSIDSVSNVDPASSTTREYQPFYSFRHGRTREDQHVFWHASRRPSLMEGDRGTEVYLNLVDLQFNPRVPAEQVLVVRTTCTNRDLPSDLQRAGELLAFELEAAAPVARIQCLRPTQTLRPPLRRGAYWRIISHLNLNHLSITDPVEGKAALQEILRLYDFSDPEAGQQMAAVTRQVIDGILTLKSRRVVGRTGSPVSSGFARGIQVEIEFDEQKYVGTGVYLFASVLERFLGLYTSINAFSQLVAKTKQGEGVLKKWPPRAADMPLL